MAAKEMYDYLSTITADYSTTTLAVTPDKILTEEGEKSQVIHIGDDGSEERISLDDDSIFYATLQWGRITASDAGTILDFFHDTAKANGQVRSFRWSHPSDGHIYVARFASALPRAWSGGSTYHQISQVKLKILGRIADA